MGTRNRNLFKDERCFFVTTTCFKWYHFLESDTCKDIICSSIAFLNNKYNTAILGYIIMPNHIHFILYFNEENKLSDWMRDLKKFTSVKIRQEIETSGDELTLEKLRTDKEGRVFRVWQERFDDVYLNDKKLLEKKLDYIHLNPLQAHWNLVKLPDQYFYSSAVFYETGKQASVMVTDYREYF